MLGGGEGGGERLPLHLDNEPALDYKISIKLESRMIYFFGH